MGSMAAGTPNTLRGQEKCPKKHRQNAQQSNKTTAATQEPRRRKAKKYQKRGQANKNQKGRLNNDKIRKETARASTTSKGNSTVKNHPHNRVYRKLKAGGGAKGAETRIAVVVWARPISDRWTSSARTTPSDAFSSHPAKSNHWRCRPGCRTPHTTPEIL